MAKHNAFPTFTVNLAVATTDAEALDSMDGVVVKGAAGAGANFIETGTFCYIKIGPEAGSVYKYDTTSLAAPDGTTVVIPRQLAATPLVAGRWLVFSRPNGGVCLAPLFRTIYVDVNTATPLADQNGSISCPYDGIQKALDTIPPLSGSDPVGLLADARQGFVILIAPGLYDEAITMPTIGRMIILRATGGFAQPSFVPIGTATGLGPIEGPPVRIEGAVANVLMDYSFLTGVSTVTSICPYYQFEGLFMESVQILGDGDADIVSGCVQSYRDCWIVFLEDQAMGPKYLGQLDFRETFVALLQSEEAGLLLERSHFGVVDCGRAQGQDSVIDDLEQFAVGSPTLDPSVMLHDCEITTAYSASGGGVPTQHDGVTEYFSSLLGAISAFETRRIQEVIGNGYWKLYKVTFGATGGTMLSDASAVLIVNPNAASRTFTLPGLAGPDGADYSHPSAGSTSFPTATNQMSRVIMVKNSITSDPAGDALLDPSSATTIEGSPSRVLAPGESLILVADGAANNWEIVASFP